MPDELIVRYMQNMANVPILYPLKTPENIWLCEVLRGYKIGTLAGDRLRLSNNICSQLAITCSKSSVETLEEGVKYVQS